ncbi:hypothetical protein GXY_05973 [Novacetimonas hansenii ATCC 23769]|uniref:Uncharacterized protein n=1 Tax=Novacetimonas hansenii ATCC 23769 TaxID=714995 RepID=D5QDI4_NOVHA|nr:hypothetical protein GXY_05973 [Novacetimonas hansenii ATCC 23769]
MVDRNNSFCRKIILYIFRAAFDVENIDIPAFTQLECLTGHIQDKSKPRLAIFMPKCDIVGKVMKRMVWDRIVFSFDVG